jgi:hypothetical protein
MSETVIPWAISCMAVVKFADDLFLCATGTLSGEVPGPFWPDENSHSTRTELQMSPQSGYEKENRQ